MGIPLKKTFFAVAVLISVTLSVVIGLGCRQFQLHRTHQNIVKQSERLVLQYALIREHVTAALLKKEYVRLPEAVGKIHALDDALAVVLGNGRLAPEYKLILINQVDLPGLVALVEEAGMGHGGEAGLGKLQERVRGLGEQLMLFNRVIGNQAKTNLVGFQTNVIGALALVLFVLVNVLLLAHRHVVLPLLDLVGKAGKAAAGGQPTFGQYGGSAEVDALSGCMQRIMKNHAAENESLLRLQKIQGAACMAATSINRAERRDQLCSDVCSALVANDAFSFAWIGARNRGDGEVVAVAAQGPTNLTDAELQACLAALRAGVGAKRGEEDPALLAYVTGKPVLYHDFFAGAARGMLKHTPWTGASLQGATLPVGWHNTCLAVLTVYSSVPKSFSGPELDVLTGMAADLGYRLARLEKEAALRSGMIFLSAGRNMTRPLQAYLLPDGTIMSLNHAALRMNRLGADVLVGEIFQDIFLAAAERATWERNLRDCATGVQVEMFPPVTIHDQDGAEKRFASHFLLGEYPEPVHHQAGVILWTGIDVTATRQAALTLEELDDARQEFMDSVSFLVMVISETGIILEANQHTQLHLGLPGTKIVGQNFFRLFYAAGREQAEARMRMVFREGGLAIFAQRFAAIPGNFLVSVYPVKAEIRGHGRMLCVASEIGQEQAVMANTLQQAHVVQLHAQAKQVADGLDALGAGIERYARVMAGNLQENGGLANQGQISAKIIGEGQRIAGIIRREGGEITRIIDQLSAPALPAKQGNGENAGGALAQN